LYISNDFNPRWTMQGAKQVMQKAYELSQDEKSKVLCRPIKKDFCNKYPGVIIGFPFPGFICFETINDLVVRKHLNAYCKVKKCLQRNEASAFSLVETLLSIWKYGTHPNDPLKEILKRYELILPKERTMSYKEDEYSVDPLVKDLINFLDDSFYGDPDSIRDYLLKSDIICKGLVD